MKENLMTNHSNIWGWHGMARWHEHGVFSAVARPVFPSLPTGGQNMSKPWRRVHPQKNLGFMAAHPIK
jgi:hypothetical protein